MTTKLSKNTHVIAFEKKGVAVEKKINDFQYDFYCKVYADMPETVSKQDYAKALAMFVIDRLKDVALFHRADASIHVCSLLNLDKKLFKKMSLKGNEFMDFMADIVLDIMSLTVETQFYLPNNENRKSGILSRFCDEFCDEFARTGHFLKHWYVFCLSLCLLPV